MNAETVEAASEMAAASPEARAEALLPALAVRAEETEALRRLSDETLADLKAAGLHRLCQPARLGGGELALDRACAVVATLAGACAATGWVTGVWTDHQILLGMFDPAAADDVWGDDPDATISAGLMRGGTGERAAGGGWRIRGKWGWSSGCDHADWFIVNAMLPTGAGGEGEPHFCVVPRAAVTIDDNWRVMGMAGTGSKNLIVEDAVVSDHRVLPTALAAAGGAARGQRDAPALYRLPHPPCVPFLLAAPALGIAESVVEAVLADMGTRGGPGGRLAEFQTLQMHLAEATGEVDAARLLLLRDTGEAMAAMAAGRALTLPERARNRRDHALVVKLCRQAVDRLFTATGGHGIFADNAIQRKFRDIHAMSGHFALSWDIAGTTYGRVAFGLDPATPLV